MKRPASGLILAAGLGSRLHPLTIRLPKPLFPAFGSTMVDLALHRMKAVLRSKDLFVNVHHLPEVMHRYFESRPAWQEVRISKETTLLGTGGAVRAIMPDLDPDADLILYNADIYSDIDLSAVLDQHRRSKAVATMVLLQSWQPGSNPVAVRGERVQAIGSVPPECRPHTFTGVHILSPEFRTALPDGGFCHIIDIYDQLLAEDALVAASVHRGIWHDTGTPLALQKAMQELLGLREQRDPDLLSCLPPDDRGPAGLRSWLHPDCTGPGLPSRPEDVLIMAPQFLPAGIHLHNCILLTDCRLQTGDSVHDGIALDELRLPFRPPPGQT